VGKQRLDPKCAKDTSLQSDKSNMKIFDNLTQLKDWVDQEPLISEWHTVSQERINQFAQSTGDQQWIHVDPERAKAGPFGKTIAHGFLTLSMVPLFSYTAFKINNVRMGVNYGLDRVRFTSPVPVDSRLRGNFVLKSVEEIDNQGLQLTWRVHVEREGSDKVVCIADTVTRLYAKMA
jgi:acyl dehydratase